jgi:hypothetical protein
MKFWKLFCLSVVGQAIGLAILGGILGYWLRNYEASIYSSWAEDRPDMRGYCASLQHPSHKSNPLIGCLLTSFHFDRHGLDFDLKYHITI